MAEAECAFGAVDVERTQGTECEEQGLFLSSYYWYYLWCYLLLDCTLIFKE